MSLFPCLWLHRQCDTHPYRCTVDLQLGTQHTSDWSSLWMQVRIFIWEVRSLQEKPIRGTRRERKMWGCVWRKADERECLEGDTVEGCVELEVLSHLWTVTTPRQFHSPYDTIMYVIQKGHSHLFTAVLCGLHDKGLHGWNLLHFAMPSNCCVSIWGSLKGLSNLLTNVDGGLLLVSCQHPHLDVSLPQTFNSLWHSLHNTRPHT